MPAIAWDQVGSRFFEAGVDRGVLYLPDKAVAWNGITGVEENPNVDVKAYYQDGVKYLDSVTLGEYNGKLKAFTYPDEFEEVVGISSTGKGLFVHEQPMKSFGLSYRTRLGDDISGLDRGYRIHLLYNLRAVPDGQAFSSIGVDVSPLEFSWAISATPAKLLGHRPTAHVSLKSVDLEPGYLAFLESILYGDELNDPRLPSLGELYDLVENRVTIVDNGDGTWTATGSEQAVMMLNATTFQLTGADATFTDAGTYVLKST